MCPKNVFFAPFAPFLPVTTSCSACLLVQTGFLAGHKVHAKDCGPTVHHLVQAVSAGTVLVLLTLKSLPVVAYIKYHPATF